MYRLSVAVDDTPAALACCVDDLDRLLNAVLEESAFASDVRTTAAAAAVPRPGGGGGAAAAHDGQFRKAASQKKVTDAKSFSVLFKKFRAEGKTSTEAMKLAKEEMGEVAGGTHAGT